MMQANQNVPRPAAAYLRVSSEDQETNASPARQLELVSEYAARHGYYFPDGAIIDLDAREAVSGTEFIRPGLTKLYTFLERNRHVKDVFIPFISRLGRDELGILVPFKTLAKAHGCRVHFASENVVTDSSTDPVNLLIQFLPAIKERSDIVKRVNDGKRRLIGKQHFGGHPPMGYRYARDPRSGQLLGLDADGYYQGYEIDPDTAETTRTLFELYLQPELNTADVARELNRRGILTPKARRSWKASAVRQIVTRAYLYAGFIYQAKGMNAPVYGEMNKRRREQFTADTWRKPEQCLRLRDVYLTPAQLETIERKTAEAKSGRTHPAHINDYRLLRHIFCGVCRSPLYPITTTVKGRRYVQYACSCKRGYHLATDDTPRCSGVGTPNATKIDLGVIGRLTEYLEGIGSGLYPIQAQDTTSERGRLEAELVTLHAQERDIQAREGEALEFLMSKVLTPERYARAIALVERDILAVREKIAAVETRLEVFAFQTAHVQFIANNANELVARLQETTDKKALKRLFGELALKVCVFPKENGQRRIRIQLEGVEI
jgi:site-specific DNA recombinase